MESVEAIAGELIRLDSQSQVSNVAVADFIAGFLSPISDRVERIEYTDPCGQKKASLVAQVGKGKGGLALSGHMDTVPGLGWPTNPFEPRAEKGRLYGLGACDMKGPLACTLVAARAYSTINSSKPLTLVYTTDEETDTEGARRIARESKILASVRPEYGIMAEPTSLHVVNAHKAAITFTATAEGRAAHSSTGKGFNANVKMIPFLDEMWQLYKELVESEAHRDPDFDPPCPDWNIVIDNFGAAPNVTVPKSQCRVNFRYTHKLEPEPIVQRVRESARTHGLELTQWASGEPLYTPPDSRQVRLALELTGEEKPLTAPYRTDACILASLFPCIVLGPGDVGQAHTVNEWVDLEQLNRGVDLYQRLIHMFCN